MAQDYTAQQQAWLGNFQQLCRQLMVLADALAASTTEYTDEFFGVGGQNAITDATAQGVAGQLTAMNVGQAVGIINGANQVLAIVGVGGTGRPYLEAMK